MSEGVTAAQDTRRPEEVDRRPEEMGRRPEEMGRRPDEVDRRPEEMGRRPRAPRPGPSRYLMLTGAKLNAGDFLIRRRCEELLSALRPGAELHAHDRWLPLPPDLVDGVDAVLLCGGPALQPTLYPGVYPLLPTLDELRPPIIAFGLGWKGIPGDDWTERTYRFDPSSRLLLERLARDGWPVSCRDAPTERVLVRAGVHGTVMTGDPAWYDPEHLGRSFAPPERLERCLVSMPAAPMFFTQAVHLVGALKARFGARRLTASFNHGWTGGEHLPAGRAAAYARLRDAAEDLGVTCVDASGGVERMLELEEAHDLHVGYRLHTHLLFLSRRKPSLLLEEDGRGSGAGETLELPGVRAWRRPSPSSAALGLLGLAGAVATPVLRRVQVRIRPAAGVVERVIRVLDAHEAAGFAAYAPVAEGMDRAYRERMRPFLESLP